MPDHKYFCQIPDDFKDRNIEEMIDSYIPVPGLAKQRGIYAWLSKSLSIFHAILSRRCFNRSTFSQKYVFLILSRIRPEHVVKGVSMQSIN